MPTTIPSGTIFPLADRALGGRLEANLRRWYGRDGESTAAIAARLADEHAISVSDETVRRWVRELGITKAKEAAG